MQAAELTQERERGIGARPLQARSHRRRTSRCDRDDYAHPIAEQRGEDSCELKSEGDDPCNPFGKKLER